MDYYEEKPPLSELKQQPSHPHQSPPLKSPKQQQQHHHDQKSHSISKNNNNKKKSTLLRPIETIRILAVGDVDLRSARQLAEHALQSEYKQNHDDDDDTTSSCCCLGGGGVDLLIARGPFLPEEQYLFVKRRTNTLMMTTTTNHDNDDSFPSSKQQQQQQQNSSFILTPELSSASLGILTGCLSQLETIVCRLLYTNNNTTTTNHPSEMITSSSTTLRLTPNARNIHQHWILICPGLGCAGWQSNITNGVGNHYHYETIPKKLLELAPSTAREKTDDTTTTTRINQDCEPSFFHSKYQTILVSPSATPTNTNGDLIPLHLQCGSGTANSTYQSDSSCRTHVVDPGSLRENGDYCLIDLALCEVLIGEEGDGSRRHHHNMPQYEWKVDNIQLHRTTE